MINLTKKKEYVDGKGRKKTNILSILKTKIWKKSYMLAVREEKKRLLIELKNKTNWHRINMNIIPDLYVI